MEIIEPGAVIESQVTQRPLILREHTKIGIEPFFLEVRRGELDYC